MLDFSSTLNLPLIFGYIIALAIFMYVLLDGFDLGVGILFPFAPSDDCRHKMMNSIAPFWDGNETWLVLGGGGLFAFFPLAYSTILQAVYLPIIIMLLGLIFRGVAFEFRFKSHSNFEQKIWDYSFHFGSLVATFFQGIILGTFIRGSALTSGTFAWVSDFSITCGVALVFGYSLLGSTWIIMKTEGITDIWARKISYYLMMILTLFIGLITLWTPFLNEKISERWFSQDNIFYLIPLPIIAIGALIYLIKSLIAKKERAPFFAMIVVFICSYIGLIFTIFPYIVPYEITYEQAAASSKSLSLLLIGVAIILPVILCYTAYSYFVFRGKAKSDSLY